MSERTVLVRLKAAVAEYIRDMRKAGQETQASFGSAAKVTGKIGERARSSTADVTRLGGAARSTGSEVAGMGGAARSAAADVDTLGGSSRAASPGVDQLGGRIAAAGDQADRAGPQIDRFSGRLRVLVETGTALGPALIPLATLAPAVVAGLATTLGFAAAGAGATAIALQGVGEALAAVEKARLDPTAANLAEMRRQLAALGPDGRAFLQILQEAKPLLRDIQATGRAGLLPGLGEGIEDLLTRGDDVSRILFAISEGLGDLASQAGEELASGEWDEFFTFVENEARPAIAALGASFGSVVRGATELWMALDPLSDAFTDVMLAGSESFESWAEGLDQTQGYREFVDYVLTTGPQVLDTVAAIGGAFLNVGEAVAPLAGPTLAVIEAVANGLSAVADTRAGQTLLVLVVGLTALSRALALVRAGGTAFTSLTAPLTGLTTKLGAARTQAQGLRVDLLAVGRTGAATGIGGAATATGKLADKGKLLKGAGIAGILGGVAVASSDATSGLLNTNTAAGLLIGSLFGPVGAAIGGLGGLMLDLAGPTKVADEALQSLQATLSETGEITAATVDELASQLADDTAVAKWAEETGASVEDLAAAFLKSRSEGVAYVQSLPSNADAGNAANAADKLTESVREYASAAYQARVEGIGAGSGLEAVALGVAATAREIARNPGFRQAARELDGLADATREVVKAQEDLDRAFGRTNAALDRREAARAYEQALLDANEALKDNGRILEENKQKGIDNRAALDAIADAGLRVAEGLKGMARVRVLEGTRQDLIKAAERFGATRRQARRLADDILDLDGLKVRAEARFEAQQAKERLKELKEGYDTLPEDLRTKLATEGVPESRREARELAREFDLTTRERRALILLADEAARQGITDLGGLLSNLTQKEHRIRVAVDAALGPFQAIGRFFDETNDVTVEVGVKGTEKTRAQVEQVAQDFEDLPPEVQTEVSTRGIPKSEEDITRLQRKYGLTPEQVKTLATLRDLASRGIAEVNNRLDGLDGRTATITVRTRLEGAAYGGVIAVAKGGYFPRANAAVRAFAAGGMDVANAHQPEYAAGPGPIRVWREPETGGESYIPHADDYRRPRAKAIAERTVELFGGDVTWHATGSITVPNRMWHPTGGHTRPATPPGGVTAEMFDDLVQAVRAARPIIGEATIAPHDYDRFLEQMRQADTAAAYAGRPTGRGW